MRCGRTAPTVVDALHVALLQLLLPAEDESLAKDSSSSGGGGGSAGGGVGGGCSSQQPQQQQQQQQTQQQTQMHQALLAAWQSETRSKLPLQELRDHTLQQIPSMGASSLTKLASAVAQQHTSCAPPWDGLWKEVGEAALPLLPQLSAAELATLAGAHTSVGRRAPRLFEAIAREAPSKLAGSTTKPRDVSALAWACAMHGGGGAEWPAMFQALGETAASNLEQFQPRDLTPLMWSLAAADVASPPLFGSGAFAAYLDEMASGLGSGSEKLLETRGGALDLPQMHQMHQWQLWCDERRFGASDACGLPEALRERCAEVFGASPPNPSLLQKQVVAQLVDLGLEPREEVRIAQGYTLDIVVAYEGVDIAVEVDGGRRRRV